MVHTARVVQVSEADVARHLSFADGALGAAGYKVTDPYLRQLVERQVRGELTGEEARALGVQRLLASYESPSPAIRQPACKQFD